LLKATISCIVSVRPTARPHGTTGLPLNGFSRNMMFEYFSKTLPRKFKFHKNQTIIMDALHEDHYTFLIISRPFLLRMRNVSDKSCR